MIRFQQYVANDNGNLTLEPGEGKAVQCVGPLVITDGGGDQTNVGAVLAKNKADIDALWTALDVRRCSGKLQSVK